MPHLVLSPRHSPDSVLIRQAALKAGWEVTRLSSYLVPKELKSVKDIIYYGEDLCYGVIRDDLNLNLSEPPIDFLINLSQDYTKRHIWSSTLKDLTECGPVFIKPALGKSFPADIYISNNKIKEVFGHDTIVLASEPVDFRLEYRAFILNNKIETISKEPYFTKTEFYYDSNRKEAIEFLENLLNDSTTKIPLACVIDIGYIKDRGWAIVEANPAWSSGIYTCDPDKALKVIERSNYL